MKKQKIWFFMGHDNSHYGQRWHRKNIYTCIYIYNYDIILILGTHEVLKQRGTSKNSEAQRGHVSSYDCSEGKTTYIGYHKIFVR